MNIFLESFPLFMLAKSIKKKIFLLFVWIWGISSFGILDGSAVAQRVYEYPLFQGRRDSVFLRFEDTLHVSAEGGFHYLYRWEVDGKKRARKEISIYFLQGGVKPGQQDNAFPRLFHGRERTITRWSNYADPLCLVMR